jgi:hypothetical protein
LATCIHLAHYHHSQIFIDMRERFSDTDKIAILCQMGGDADERQDAGITHRLSDLDGSGPIPRLDKDLRQFEIKVTGQK